MNSPSPSTSVILLLSAAFGCGDAAKVVDIGDNNTAELGVKLSDYSGTWEGYVEAYRFSDGSDRVRLQIAQDGTGTLELGDSPPLVVARDQVALAASPTQIPGFRYPLSDVSVADERIRASVQLLKFLDDWCVLFQPVLQVPRDASGPEYACSDQQAREAPDCWDDHPGAGLCVANACLVSCHCNADSCYAPSYDVTPNQVSGNTLDGMLLEEGDVLLGTLHLDVNRLTFRMRRQ
jgi:hypothetical protein